MAYELMYFPNDDTHNYLFCRLQLVVKTFLNSTQWTNQKLVKVPKLVKPTYKKTLL